MRLRCKSCGAQIEARDINLAALKAQCAVCGGKFHFGQEDVPPVGMGVAGEPEALTPNYIHVSTEADRLILRRRWRDGPLDWMAYLLLLWYGLLALGAWQSWRSALPWQQTFQLTMLIIVLAGVGVLGIYAFIQGLVNSTWVTVSPRSLRVSHGPLRVSRRRALDWDFEAATPQIRQVYARMAINPSAAPSIHGGYDIHVIQHSGAHEVALHGIPTENEAVFLCQQIRKQLQLPRLRLEQRSAPEQVPRPEKIEVEITTSTLTLVYKFGTIISLTPSIIAMVIGFIVVLVLLATSVMEAQSIGWFAWPLSPLLAAEVLGILCVLRLALRRRVIHVSKNFLTIDEAPLALQKGVRLPLQGVPQFYCTARPRRLRPPWRTGSALAFVYEVWCVDGEGQNRRLIKDLPASDEAFFIEQEIERHLGLEDTVVKGEITRPGSAKALDLQRQLNERHDLLSTLRLEASYSTGQQYPPSLSRLLHHYQNTGDETLLEDAARVLQLPASELERVIWELEETPESAAADSPTNASSPDPTEPPAKGKPTDPNTTGETGAPPSHLARMPDR